jgi:hypothetical protein
VVKFLRNYVFDESADEIHDRLRNLRSSLRENIVGGTQDFSSREVWLELQRTATHKSFFSQRNSMGAALRPLVCRYASFTIYMLILFLVWQILRQYYLIRMGLSTLAIRSYTTSLLPKARTSLEIS